MSTKNLARTVIEGGRTRYRRGSRWFWFVLTENGRYRQQHPLGEVDAARWQSLPRWFREPHDALGPRHTVEGR
jgi:hypothetical protein